MCYGYQVKYRLCNHPVLIAHECEVATGPMPHLRPTHIAVTPCEGWEWRYDPDERIVQEDAYCFRCRRELLSRLEGVTEADGGGKRKR